MKNFIHKIFNKSLISILALMSSAYPLFADANHQHSTMDHTKHSHPGKQNYPSTLKLTVQKILAKGGQQLVTIKLTDIQTNQPINLRDLNEVHTQKIHLLIIDDNLSDYTHTHPQATNKAGVYQFTWQPTQKNATYRIWADLVPTKTNRQEYVISNLLSAPQNTLRSAHQLARENTVDGYTFKLSFDQKQLKVGKPALGTIHITDTKGNPVRSLESVMGAYAHIVGFNDDFKTIVHIHPMGSEPQKSSDRGGPELQFHLVPEKAGFTKLYAQVKINGKELFVPFGIKIYKS
ncbi:hypothetical protein [Legionella feeleii]|uniref:Secreted protein n=1 Tax=Legionella feeleii TaxID=453 RepID=A0A0W0U009_9GAMM|nr:hypothetical protein [Legionella feeleii]KTD01232.1 hypothetical protein Lfee_1171 [Legionella feeleii]SPX60538.1 secreted protein [Legionella feeleii]